jgi:hypothetical protein
MNFAYCLHIVLANGKYTEVFTSDFFWRGLRGWGFGGGSFHGGCVLVGRDSSMKGILDFTALFKKRSEVK